jgi:LPXTG-motif cell wall-anchored protein
MKRFTIILIILCFSLAALMFSSSAQADTWNKKTVLTFSQPIEVPGGIILPAGTYVFLLMDSQSDRHIVQIFNEDQNHLFATILAIPNYRLESTDKTVITFGERAAGSPEAIRAWFYPGANWGEEFVYPKTRAVELARVTRQPVIAMPVELEPVIKADAKSETDEPIVALRTAPLKSVQPTGEETDYVVEKRDAQVASNIDTGKSTNRLPQTASQLPLFALIGFLSLGAGFGLLVAARRFVV